MSVGRGGKASRQKPKVFACGEKIDGLVSVTEVSSKLTLSPRWNRGRMKYFPLASGSLAERCDGALDSSAVSGMN